MDSLNNRTFVVLGAAGGVGAAVSERLAARSARLLLNDLGCDLRGVGADDRAVLAVAERARALGAQVAVDASDVSAPGVVASLLDRATRELGTVHGVVHAAAFVREATVLKLAEDDVQAALSLEVVTAARVLRDASERFIEAGIPGSIVFVVSPTAFFGVARRAVSAACSGAVMAMVRTASLELRKHGIRVNAVAPTARTRQTEDTPYFKSIRPDSMTPEQTAPLVSYLLSDEAREVSGEWLGTAGGRIYGLSPRETTGVFLGPAHGEDDIARELRSALVG